MGNPPSGLIHRRTALAQAPPQGGSEVRWGSRQKEDRFHSFVV
ncbi:hypothetical protein [Chlorogloeopsis sp. ULAP02]